MRDIRSTYSTSRRRRTAGAKDAVSEVGSAREAERASSRNLIPLRRERSRTIYRKRARTPVWAFAFCLSVLLLAPVSSLALESEPTREVYVASVEPICKANKQSSDRLLKPVKSLVKQDKLQQASRRFAKAAAALEKAQKQLTAVPQPSADEAKLGKWLAGIEAEVALMRRIAAKLGQGNAGKASSLAVKLTHDATTTNNLVIAFQFNYCRIDPSQYT